LKGVSEAVEEAMRKELSEWIIVEALERIGKAAPGAPAVRPVETRVETSAGEVIREMRGRAA